MSKIIDLSKPVLRHADGRWQGPVVRSVLDIAGLPLDRLVTLATVLDLRDRDEIDVIDRPDIARWGVADIGGCIIQAGAGEPVLSVAAAAYLLESGVRTIAADFTMTGAAAEMLLDNGCVLVCGLLNLDDIESHIIRLVALPLRVEGVFVAEARVIAIEEN